MDIICNSFVPLQWYTVYYAYGRSYSFSFLPSRLTSRLHLQTHPGFCEASCHAFVCDLTADRLTDFIPGECVDLATMVFVLSAITPEKMADALRNIFTVRLQTCSTYVHVCMDAGYTDMTDEL